METVTFQRPYYRPLVFLLAALLGLQLLSLNARRPVLTGELPLPRPPLDLIRIPLSFEANAGQTDGSVDFLARGLGGTLFFRAGEVALALPGVPAEPGALQDGSQGPAAGRQQLAALQVRFLGADPAARPVGVERQPGTANYLIGDDPAEWHRDIPTYASIRYEGLYPGIDLHYEGVSGRLKGTYLLAPGADPARIRWQHSGAKSVQVDPSSGELRITLDAPEPITLVEQAPLAWQELGGRRVPVAARYVNAGDGSVRFDLGPYDAAQPLVIDPTLVYSSYLGGSITDYAYDIAVDPQGNFYVTGATGSPDFPLVNPVQSTQSQYGDLFVSKFNPSGTALVYSTYLGGDDSDVGFGIKADGAGNAYVTGESWSTDFPTLNAIQPNHPGLQQDVIVFKLNPAGNGLVYSTYLGGIASQTGRDIAIDASGSVYITGHTLSENFPVLNAIQPQRKGVRDAFVLKINSAGSALVYSTFLGSSGDLDYGFGIAVDGAGSAYVTGQTTKDDFPTVNPLQPANGGFGEIFVSKLSPDGTALVYSTYLGGADNESGKSIAVDSAGNAIITGATVSSNFPTANALQPAKNEFHDVFVAKINAAGSALVYSTYLGGSGEDGNHDSNVAVDSDGNAYVAGNTSSTDFPVVNAFQPVFGGYAHDVFIAKLDPQGSALLYSSYLGGSTIVGGLGDFAYGLALDGNGNAYVTGHTFSQNFPLAGEPYQANNRGNYDAFVAIINDGGDPPPTPTPAFTPTATPTPAPASLHVGDLDGSTSGTNRWTAFVTITVHDANHNPVSNATVTGSWSNGASGTSTCTTDSSGRCTVSKSIPRATASVTFTVTNLASSGFAYAPAANHDPDGDSNGTSITVSK
jgi:hypothetical protein